MKSLDSTYSNAPLSAIESRAIPWPVMVLLGALAISVTNGLSFVMEYELVLKLVVVLFVAGVFLARPTLMWAVLMIALPFSIEYFGMVGGSHNLVVPTEVLLPLVVVVVFLRLVRNQGLCWTESPLHVFVIGWVLWQFASLYTSEFPMVTLKASVRTAGYVLIGYILTQAVLQRFSTYRKTLIGLGLSSALLVVYGFYTQFVEGIAIYQDIAHPFFNNHCIYAGWLCFPAIFCLAVMATCRPVSRWATALFVLISFGILLSFVRGAWLGMLASVGYVAVQRKLLISWRFVVVSILLVVLASGVVVWQDWQDLFIKRWETMFDQRFVANANRIDRWAAAWGMWREHPWMGVGFGTYADQYPKYIYDVRAYERDIRMGSHNLYLEILAELGVVGLLIFGGILVGFYRETRTLLQLAPDNSLLKASAVALFAMMVAYLVHGLVNNLGPSDKIEVTFWAMCGLAIALRRFAQTHQLSSE